MAPFDACLERAIRKNDRRLSIGELRRQRRQNAFKIRKIGKADSIQAPTDKLRATIARPYSPYIMSTSLIHSDVRPTSERQHVVRPTCPTCPVHIKLVRRWLRFTAQQLEHVSHGPQTACFLQCCAAQPQCIRHKPSASGHRCTRHYLACVLVHALAHVPLIHTSMGQRANRLF